MRAWLLLAVVCVGVPLLVEGMPPHTHHSVKQQKHVFHRDLEGKKFGSTIDLLNDSVLSDDQEKDTPPKKPTEEDIPQHLLLDDKASITKAIAEYQSTIKELKDRLREQAENAKQSTPKSQRFEEEQRALLTTWSALNLPLKWKRETLFRETIPPALKLVFGSHEFTLCSADSPLPEMCSSAQPLVDRFRTASKTGAMEASTSDKETSGSTQPAKPATESDLSVFQESEYADCTLENSKILYVGKQGPGLNEPLAAACVSFLQGGATTTAQNVHIAYQSGQLRAPINFEFRASKLPGNDNPELFSEYLKALRAYHTRRLKESEGSNASEKAQNFNQFMKNWRQTMQSFLTSQEFTALNKPDLDNDVIAQMNTMCRYVIIREAAVKEKITWDRALEFLPTIPDHKGFLKFSESDSQSRENARITANPDVVFAVSAGFDVV